MWLLTGIAIAALSGVVSAYSSRLQGTSLWAGKALVPPQAAASSPRGVQDALLQGFESWLGLLIPIAALSGGVLAFQHAWWGAVLAYLAFSLCWVISDRLVVPSTIDWYLLRLHVGLANRAANHLKGGDALRADAALTVDQGLQNLYQLYAGQGIPAPSVKLARRAPYGDDDWLLLHAQSDVQSKSHRTA